MITQSLGVPRSANFRSFDLPEAERVVERQRMRKAALVVLRRHHPDVVRQDARDALEHLEPGGVDAVVIGDENAHGTWDYRFPLRFGHEAIEGAEPPDKRRPRRCDADRPATAHPVRGQCACCRSARAVRTVEMRNAAMNAIVIRSTMVGAGALSMKKLR